jgi:8-oxo-dGTP pyrophosphatase MutT (NUDIX family)
MNKINDRAIAIVLKGNQVLMLWRFFNEKEYYVFPGGTQEEGEDIVMTLKREVYEELNLNIKKIFEFVHQHQNGDGSFSPRTEHYFLINKFEGDIKMGAPELFKQNRHNIYRPEWIDLHSNNVDYEPSEIFEIIKSEVQKL